MYVIACLYTTCYANLSDAYITQFTDVDINSKLEANCRKVADCILCINSMNTTTGSLNLSITATNCNCMY